MFKVYNWFTSKNNVKWVLEQSLLWQLAQGASGTNRATLSSFVSKHPQILLFICNCSVSLAIFFILLVNQSLKKSNNGVKYEQFLNFAGNKS